MGTYEDYLASMGFGAGTTLAEADRNRKRAQIETEAAAQQQAADLRYQRTQRATDWKMEDRGLFQSGVRTAAQADVDVDHQMELAAIERAKQADLADVDFAALRELRAEARQRDADQLSWQQLELERQRAAAQAELDALQRRVLWEQIQYQQRMVNMIASGWGG